MNSEKVWLRWVREGSAYTITKSRRKKVQVERVRAAALLIGYTAGRIELIKGRDDPYMGEDPYRRYIDFGYGKILNNSYNIEWGMREEFIESLLEDYNPLDEYPTLKRFLFYACDVIIELNSYINTSPNSEMKELCKRQIKRIVESLHSPKGGAIARRAFVEVENVLKEIAMAVEDDQLITMEGFGHE